MANAVEHVLLHKAVAFVEPDGTLVTSNDEQDVGLGVDAGVQRFNERGTDALAPEALLDVDAVKLRLLAEAVEVKVADYGAVCLSDKECRIVGCVAIHDALSDCCWLIRLRRDGIHHDVVNKSCELHGH